MKWASQSNTFSCCCFSPSFLWVWSMDITYQRRDSLYKDHKNDGQNKHVREPRVLQHSMTTQSICQHQKKPLKYKFLNISSRTL